MNKVLKINKEKKKKIIINYEIMLYYIYIF